MVLKKWVRSTLAFIWVVTLSFLAPVLAGAHCDTMDGPVVLDGQLALDKGEITPVLKWIRPNDEAEVQAVFKKTMAVRPLGKEAREVADRFFLETLVRLHRVSEGEAYTGLKPAGADPGPAIKGAEKALETGSVDNLTKLLTKEAAAGLNHRFHVALEKKKHAAQSVTAGREYVKAFVEFIHYAEKLHSAARGAGGHHAQAGCPAADGHKDH